MTNNRNLRGDKIVILFRDAKFVETLKKWKTLCSSTDGGQTERLQKLIEGDVKKLKSEVVAEIDKF